MTPIIWVAIANSIASAFSLYISFSFLRGYVRIRDRNLLPLFLGFLINAVVLLLAIYLVLGAIGRPQVRPLRHFVFVESTVSWLRLLAYALILSSYITWGMGSIVAIWLPNSLDSLVIFAAAFLSAFRIRKAPQRVLVPLGYALMGAGHIIYFLAPRGIPLGELAISGGLILIAASVTVD